MRKKKEKKINATALAGGATLSALPASIGVVALIPAKESGKYKIKDIERASGVSGVKYRLNETTDITRNSYLPAFLSPDKKKTINGSVKRPTLLSHEMGHMSSPLSNSKAGLGAYSASKLSSMISPFYGAYRGSKGEKISGKERAVAYLAALPMVAEESRANFIAARAAHRLGGRKGLLRAVPSILGSQLSYMGAGAGIDISNYIARKLNKTLRKKK